jgi:cytochrome P450
MDHGSEISAQCPYQPERDDRKSTMAALAAGAATQAQTGQVFKIETFDLARQVLRSGSVRQAGFRAELLARFSDPANVPVLYQEGEAHHKQRSATARFFAPKVVTTQYRALIDTLSKTLVERFRKTGHANLDDLSLELAVAVAAEIIGLTESNRAGMARRLNRFFELNATPHPWRIARLISGLRTQASLMAFYLADVKPAIRARRRARREDVISHLLDQKRSNQEILTECLTYGAAGMATTREFIVMCAWYMLEDPSLQARFLETDEAGRLALLEEMLRLEPVVGALYRRCLQEMTLNDQGRQIVIPAGSLVVIDLRAAKTDPLAAGRCPFSLEPERTRPDTKAAASLMSFGDGAHRCPGASVALLETALFLERLLRVEGIQMQQNPTVTLNVPISSYELRGARIAIA